MESGSLEHMEREETEQDALIHSYKQAFIHFTLQPNKRGLEQT
jgi:hypothetical protein